MKYASNILHVIGNTPLVQLNSLGKTKATLLVKLEYLNPGGSVKDRIGLAMIEDAERKGLLKPGGIIIEPTSGNTGMGLAMAANIKGYKTLFVMPDKVSKEKENLLKAYGAQVVRTPTNVDPEDPRSYYKVAKKLVQETQNSFSPNQYYNPVNPRIHYETTGPEIWKDTDGRITHFVSGMGTGGTITGVAKFLKEKNPHIKVIGADPEGSIYHETFYKTKGEIHTYKVEGIGEDFHPSTMDLGLLDEVVIVQDQEAFDATRALVRKEAILVGGSSGAAVAAALKYLPKLKASDVMVILLPDSGKSYMSTVFNGDWMKQNSFNY